MVSLNSQLELLQGQNQEKSGQNSIMKEKLAITEGMVRELEVYKGAWEKSRMEDEQRGRRWEEEERRLKTKIEVNSFKFNRLKLFFRKLKMIYMMRNSFMH